MQTPDVRLVTEEKLAAELEGITGAGIPIFETLAEAEAYEAANPGKTALTIEQVVPAETVPPTAGTLASSAITQSGFTLTVSGASDAVGLHASPYSFSTDGGATWSAYQSSASLVVTGKAHSTAYQCRHRVRDAAGNVSTGTQITVTTAVFVESYWDFIQPDAPAVYMELAGSTLESVSGTTATSKGVTYEAGVGFMAGKQVAKFDSASAARIDVTAPASILSATAITYEAVARFEASNTHTLAVLGTSGNETDVWRMNSARNVQAFLYNTAGNFVNPSDPTSNNASAWHHLALTMAVNGQAKIYVNGIQVASVAANASRRARTAGDLLYFGGNSADTGTSNTRLSHVAVYPTQLSDARILAHAQKVGAA